MRRVATEATSERVPAQAYIDPDDYAQLVAHAAKTERSVAAVIRLAIRQYLKAAA